MPPVSTQTPAARAGLEPGRALAFLVGLIDDAAAFPPGALTVGQSVAAHREHRAAPYGVVVGPLPAPVSRLDEVLDALDAERTSEPFDLVLVADAGLVQAAAARAELLDDDPVELLGLEVATAAAIDGSDEQALAAHLADRDDAPLPARLSDADPTVVRRRFTSFGSCSISDPVSDLRGLGMLDEEEGR